jgi:hypothetical protein
MVQEHLILGIDERDLEIEKGRWLTDNPCIKVIETIIRQEPRNLLARIGGRCAPRLSMLVRYHAVASIWRKPRQRLFRRQRLERPLKSAYGRILLQRGEHDATSCR